MDHDIWADRLLYDDGEWVTWSDLDEFERHESWGQRKSDINLELIPYFENLLSLAQTYHLDTGRHLSVYGDIGELYAAIMFGLELHKLYQKLKGQHFYHLIRIAA